MSAVVDPPFAANALPPGDAACCFHCGLPLAGVGYPVKVDGVL